LARDLDMSTVRSACDKDYLECTSMMPDKAARTMAAYTSALAHHTCSSWKWCQSMRRIEDVVRPCDAKLPNPRTDSDMCDMPALRLQSSLGDVSYRQHLRTPSKTPSCLLEAVFVRTMMPSRVNHEEMDSPCTKPLSRCLK
jgi:hypothetical protein